MRKPTLHRSLLSLFPALACACIGDVGAGPSGAEAYARRSANTPGSTSSGLFACDPDAQPESTGWRRLTRLQYEHTLEAALDALVSGADRDAVWSAVERPLGAMAEETRFVLPEDLHGSYRRLSQSVDQQLVESWYQVARAAADALASPGRLEKVFGACATDGDAGNDAACVDALVDRWAPHVFRRPVDRETRAFYRGFFGDELGSESLPQGFADVLAGMLNAPEMLYLVEHGEAPEDGSAGVVALDAHELAARLSYHFWAAPPDDALRALADSGALLDDATYRGEVDRLFDDPRTRDTLREFYRDWLKLEDVPALDIHNGDARFAAFAGDDLPGPELRDEAIDEILRMLDHYTWDTEGDLADVLTTPFSFAEGPSLAQLYGIEPWDGRDSPPEFAEGERPGLLTRLAFLGTGTVNTRPVMKGVFIRRYLLCDDIPPPPDNAFATPPELSDTLSTREVVEELTEQPETDCVGCHATLINGLGFATEGFDALGRPRDTQVLYDEDGTEVGEAPIDTVSQPNVAPGDTTLTTGPDELAARIVESGKAHACLARNYFRFSFGRWEDTQRDGCALQSLHEGLVEGGSLRAMLRSVALTDAFRHRTF